MTITPATGRRPALLAVAAALCLAAAAPPGAAAANAPAGRYYERAMMGAANARCGLFSRDMASALAAAEAQARGAALRAGADERQLAQVRIRAELKAAATPCGAPDLKVAAARVRSAFEGYSRLTRMTFPGDAGAWRAERVVSSKGESWFLSQTAPFGREQLTFGLAGPRGQTPVLTVAARFDAATPYAARLVMRDQSRAPRAYLGGKGLTSRAPQPSAARSFVAVARSRDDGALTPDKNPGTVFRFSAEAQKALTLLDPREAIAVEFVFSGRGGDVVRRAVVEVGDFAAGQAFLSAARR